MYHLLRDRIVESVQRRVAQGDCPTEPAQTVEMLEQVILDLAESVKKSDPLNLPSLPKIQFVYTNYRGETSVRKAVPIDIRWGTTQWHPEPGYLFKMYDLEKKEMREFALADCDFTKTEIL